MALSARTWLWLLVAAVAASIVVAALIPVGWQVRLGLHWLVEHFLGFFVLTALVCFAFPRPMAVAAVLLPFALLVEAAQMLTSDRVADPATALSAAAGVAAAALLADAALAWRKTRRKA